MLDDIFRYILRFRQRVTLNRLIDNGYRETTAISKHFTEEAICVHHFIQYKKEQSSTVSTGFQ